MQKAYTNMIISFIDKICNVQALVVYRSFIYNNIINTTTAGNNTCRVSISIVVLISTGWVNSRPIDLCLVVRIWIMS
jgi:hypothetical protein